MTRSELSSLDLATISAVRMVLGTAFKNQVCKWEQDSTDAASDGRLSNALMLEHWAFAAQLLSTIASSELTALFSQIVDARFGDMNRDGILNAMALEVAAAQDEPEEEPEAVAC